MADVRSMLRASREARRINHPNASYTTDGKLLCNLCETLVKTEASWQGHLHSQQHSLRQTRAKDAAAARVDSGTNRKRKASISESPSLGDRKKSKPTVFAPGIEDEEGKDREEAEEALPVEGSVDDTQEIEGVVSTKGKAQVEDAPADPAAMEAFERELAAMEADFKASTSEQAGVTISAAPMTAEEIAAQAREEQSAQRGRRDVELEAEKEDAARLLEDEFEEMEGLEERVKKLREKREALRKNSNGAGNERPTSPDIRSAQHNKDDDPSEEDDDDEDYDDWAFGAR